MTAHPPKEQQAEIINKDSFNIGEYDQIDLTYVAAGNGAGEVETVTYIKGGVTLATLTLSYDASDRVSSVVKS